MEDFYYAGGVPAFRSRLASKLALSVRTVSGRTLGEDIAGAKVYNADVIRPLDNPISNALGLAVLRGNLAPDGAVMKPAAAEPRLWKHAGPALVFRDYNEMAAMVDATIRCHARPRPRPPERGAGRRPGAEWGMLPIPKLLKQGVRDMVTSPMRG